MDEPVANENGLCTQQARICPKCNQPYGEHQEEWCPHCGYNPSAVEELKQYQTLKSVLAYKVGYTPEQVLQKLIDLLNSKEYCSEEFKAKFLKQCKEENLVLTYYPIVYWSSKLTELTWTVDVSYSYVSGYSGTIDSSGNVSIHENRASTDSHEETKQLWSWDLAKLSPVETYEAASAICHPPTTNYAEETMRVMVDDRELEELQKKTWYRDDKEKSFAYSHATTRRDVRYKYDRTSVVAYFPMYQIKIEGKVYSINGWNGDVKSFPYEYGGKYYDSKVQTAKKRDIVHSVYKWTLFSIMLFVDLYVLILGDIDIVKHNLVTTQEVGVKWAVFVLANLIGATVWGFVLYWQCWRSSTPYMDEFNEFLRDQSGKGEYKVKFKPVFKNFFVPLFIAVLGVGLASIFIAFISGIFGITMNTPLWFLK